MQLLHTLFGAAGAATFMEEHMDKKRAKTVRGFEKPLIGWLMNEMPEGESEHHCYLHDLSVSN